MIIVCGHLDPDPADRDAFVADSVEFVRGARSTAGCLDFAVAADPVDPGRVNVLERWHSEATLRTFRGDGPDEESASRIALAEDMAETSGLPRRHARRCGRLARPRSRGSRSGPISA